MGEAIISRFGAAEDPNAVKMGWKLYTEIITENTTYTVPTCKNQELHVMLFGGGGGVYNGQHNAVDGGGGGNMNTNIITLSAGSAVNISIGAGGGINANGGTTSFGSYLSATGGECYGNGGTGGGKASSSYIATSGRVNGSDGYYGGGGAACTFHQLYGNQYQVSRGGNGGKYGGQGASMIGVSGSAYYLNSIKNNIVNDSIGLGVGTGGYFIIDNTANGKVQIVLPTNGVKVKNDIEFDFGIAINSLYKDAGCNQGYEFSYNNSNTSSIRFTACFHGAGGYGGHGGERCNIFHRQYDWYNINCYTGGGGYMANGGNGMYYYWSSTDYAQAGGGGGGYGHKGGDAVCSGVQARGGGGGGYGPSGYASGGTYDVQNSGNNGICIIQYYGIVYE